MRPLFRVWKLLRYSIQLGTRLFSLAGPQRGSLYYQSPHDRPYPMELVPAMKPLLRLLLSILILSWPLVAQAQVAPEKSIATFKVADDLQISLWASEPLFVNPTCMDIDHKGRVWVCESVNYRCHLHGQPKRDPKGDRIVILEDSTGSGKADKAITFYQAPELHAPLGIAVLKSPNGPGYRVYVCQSPDILVFEDSDGDGKADGPPRKLLTGIGGYDHDHGVHSILIGPDNKLYFTVGDTGVRNFKGVDGKKTWNNNDRDLRAGSIWRCDLDGKNLELIAHNFRNEYECAVDSFGTVFVSDNDDDGNQQTRICHVMPGGNYGYHPRGANQTHWHEEQPGIVPKILRTYFGSPTGMCVYEGTLLPKKYQGQLLHTDAGPRHVRSYHLKPSGASYEVDREDIVTSTDTWFRPSDVCVAPDGSVFVADWYDPGVGGHGVGDLKMGRILRLTPKGYQGTRMPEVKLDTPDGIRTALASPALSVRAMALGHLATLEWEKAKEILDPALAQKENPWLKARAIWVTGRQGPASHTTNTVYSMYQQACRDKDDPMQIVCLRVLNDCIGSKPQMDIPLENPSLAVAREALLLLRDATPVRARDSIMELARLYDGKDRFFLEAVGIAVGIDPDRRRVILPAFAKLLATYDSRSAGLLWELRPEGMGAKLGEWLTGGKLSPQAQQQIVEILAQGDAASGLALVKALQVDLPVPVRLKIDEAVRNGLAGNWGSLQHNPDLEQIILEMLAKPPTRVNALELIGAAKKENLVKQVIQLAADPMASTDVRRVALQTLASLPREEAVRILAEFLEQDQNYLKLAAFRGLGRVIAQPKWPANEKAIQALELFVMNDKQPLPYRKDILGLLAGNKSGSLWILDLKERGVLPEPLVADAARLMRLSPFQELKTRITRAFPPPGRLDPRKLPSLSDLVTHKGNAERGRQLMNATATNDMQCLKCHTIQGKGGAIGPDLSMIGKKGSRENLFESILNPSKAIADQYITWLIETSKGQLIAGLLVEENDQAVTLRDGNGKDVRIPRTEIEGRSKSPKSLMPEDLLLYMTQDDLVDMVEYMTTLKTAAVAFDYWDIVGPFDNGSNDEGLDKVFPPEKGIDLKATYSGKGGATIGWKRVKPDPRGYVDLQAHYSPTSEQIVSYLVRDIESPVDQEANILIGNDDGCKVWINDKQVYNDRRHNAAVPEADRIKLNLVKGRNRILIKINNGGNPHGLYFTLLSDQEVKRLETK